MNPRREVDSYSSGNGQWVSRRTASLPAPADPIDDLVMGLGQSVFEGQNDCLFPLLAQLFTSSVGFPKPWLALE